MARQTQYLQGFREASKLAVKTVHQEAASMNDPHAKQVLNNMGFWLGNELVRAYKERCPENEEPDT